MPRDGSGTYSLPAGYTAVPGTTILDTQHNTPLEDIRDALTGSVARNGAGAMTGLLTLSGDPSTSLQAATKQYVDNSVLGGAWKPICKISTTANITLSGEQTLDGVLTSATRVRVGFQTAAAENGIYVSNSGSWIRATDMDAWTEVPGSIVHVEQGTLYADTLWMCTSNTGGTLGSTAIDWIQLPTIVAHVVNAQTGTTYTTLTGDRSKLVTYSNAAAIAVTQPQANSSTFSAGWFHFAENIGAGAVTYTPITSTINGAATLVLRKGQWALIVSDGTNFRALLGGVPTEVLVIAVGDETTAITAGTTKVTFRMPFAMTLTAVRASLSTAQASGSIFTVDINDSGTTVISTKLTIDNTEKTSTTAATPAVISDSALADDAEITIDVDQIGNGSAKGLKVTLIGVRS